MKIYILGRAIGIGLMLISFCWLVYLLLSGEPMILVWEVATMFWFGCSLFWESCF